MSRFGTTILAALGMVALASCSDTKIHEPSKVLDIQSSLKAATNQGGTKMSNKEAGLKFLEENKTKEGVKVTPSGLQYKVIKEGTGASPKATDVVSVNYEGRHINGEVFDASRLHGGAPATFPLNQVIPGWTEGVQLMKEGGKYTFYIPSELAYGTRGAPGAIGPDEVLIFDVELVSIKK